MAPRHRPGPLPVRAFTPETIGELQAHYRAVDARLADPRPPVAGPAPVAPAPAPSAAEMRRERVLFFESVRPVVGAPHTVRSIVAVVAAVTGLTHAELRSGQRGASLAKARHIACYLCARLTTASLPMIGRALDKDHTTVLYARERVRKVMDHLGLPFGEDAVALATALWQAPWPRHPGRPR